MYCKYCGKQIADDSKFCMYCGKQIVDVASPSLIQETYKLNTINIQQNIYQERKQIPSEVLLYDPHLYVDDEDLLYYKIDGNLIPYSGVAISSNTGNRIKITYMNGKNVTGEAFHSNGKLAWSVTLKDSDKYYNTWGLRMSEDDFMKKFGDRFRPGFRLLDNIKHI